MAKPVVTLHHADVQHASLAGVGLVVLLRVANPNSDDAGLERNDYPADAEWRLPRQMLIRFSSGRITL